MIEAANDPRPSVLLPRDIVPLPLAIGLGALMALGLLVYLIANQQARDTDRTRLQVPAQTAPPELVVPPPPAVGAPQPAIAPPRPIAPVRAPIPERRIAPAPPNYPPFRNRVPPREFVTDDIEPRPRPPGGNGLPLAIDLTTGPGGRSIDRPGEGENPEARRPPEDESARATQIRNRSTMIPQGAIIAAVLETPLNSDRPGMARAIVSQDVRGFDGSRVLVPRGSRLIGEFKAEVTPGLRRIPVIWSRLIRPDGVAIRIRSPGADALGGAGIGGRTNTHLGERLFSAVLQSALTVGVNILSTVPTNSSSPIYVGLPGQAQRIGEQLVPKADRPPTVKVREGAEISVLVARDLDFGGTPPVR
jgi:type IV secretion system protein VirB10